MPQVFDEAIVVGDTRDTDESLHDENATFDQSTSPHAPDALVTDTPKKGRRKPLPAHLPRENVIHDLSDDDKLCACGCQRSKIGEEISEKLEVIPAQLKVIRHIRLKYACKACAEGVVTTPMPKQPIPKGIPTAGLLAHVCVAKYDDHLPLYRQSEIWERLGVDLSRSTLSSWVLQVGILLQPMITLLRAHMIHSGYVRADETTTQVFKEPGRIPTTQSYMWLYMTGNHRTPAIVYEYQPTRHGNHAKTFLNGFNGTLQTDGYSGYHAVTESEAVMSA